MFSVPASSKKSWSTWSVLKSEAGVGASLATMHRSLQKKKGYCHIPKTEPCMKQRQYQTTASYLDKDLRWFEQV